MLMSALLLGLSGAAALFPNNSEADAPKPPAIRNLCAAGDGPQETVRLTWGELTTDTSDVALTSPIVHLRVENTSSASVYAVIVVSADAGGPEQDTFDLPPVLLAGGSTNIFPIDISTLQLNIGSMRFSGRLSASVRTYGSPNPSEVEARGAYFAPTLYFHPATTSGSVLRVYGEKPLRFSYRSGDLYNLFGYGSVDSLYMARASNGGSGALGDDVLQQERTPSNPFDLPLVAPGAGTPTSIGSIQSPNGTITGGGSAASMKTYSVRIRLQAGFTDAGFAVKAGDGSYVKEDYLIPPVNPGFFTADVANQQFDVLARGIRVEVNVNGAATYYWADPTTAAVTFMLPSNVNSFQLRVWSHFRTAEGNELKVVTGAGTAWAWSKLVSPQPNKLTTYAFGDYDSNATMAAAVGFCGYRYSYKNANKTMIVSTINTCSSPGGNTSSAHFDDSGLAGGTAYVRIYAWPGSGDCDKGDHRRRKFTIAHELGHAWLLLRTKTFEPSTDSDAAPADETVCGTGSGYSISSLEYNSICARESAAHFYAAVCFNNPTSGLGAFRWFGSSVDLEYFNAANTSGGRLENQCTTADKKGFGTNLDWMRFWWDWVTPYAPVLKPSGNHVASVYEEAIAAGGLTKSNYYTKFKDAMLAVISNATWQGDWTTFAAHNGIDH